MAIGLKTVAGCEDVLGTFDGLSAMNPTGSSGADGVGSAQARVTSGPRVVSRGAHPAAAMLKTVRRPIRLSVMIITPRHL